MAKSKGVKRASPSKSIQPRCRNPGKYLQRGYWALDPSVRNDIEGLIESLSLLSPSTVIQFLDDVIGAGGKVEVSIHLLTHPILPSS
jgi:hypothetical protein